MAKKQGKKEQRIDENGTILIDPPKTVGTNKENYQRLNYLYQLSMWSTMKSDSSPISRMYNRNLDLISKKVKCHVSPQIKRTICKKCHRLLIPSRTCKITIENKSRKRTTKNDNLVVRCQCGEEKVFRIGLNPEYKPFHERNLIRTEK